MPPKKKIKPAAAPAKKSAPKPAADKSRTVPPGIDSAEKIGSAPPIPALRPGAIRGQVRDKPAVKKTVRIPAPKKAAVLPPPPETAAGEERYWEAVGRRKTAVARVRLFTRGEKGVWINQKALGEYFRYPPLGQRVQEALETMKTSDRFRVSARVSGGGLSAQAEAVRHATARALVRFNPDFRKRLKKAGFLTRDPRMKERKKFGLKGARRAPQWAKR